MSWINDLYETYESNFNMDRLDFKTGRMPLPISHTTQQAQIEIFLDKRGDFVTAEALDKENSKTVIPVTEDSASRTSGACAHPLEDKLEYIAGDFEKYTGIDNSKKHGMYLEELSGWCESPYSCRQIEAVREYVERNSMMADLVRSGVLKVSEEGRLTNDKINNIDQKDCFIRFSVDMADPGEEAALYKSKEVFRRYIDYYGSKSGKEALCYVSGEIKPCSEKHGAKIRSAGDKAKLISANDNSGFTYRGRLSEADQVLSIGYDVSQKAHSALRWIMEKQGFNAGEMKIAAWEISGKEVPEVLSEGSDIIFQGKFEDLKEKEGGIDEAYARRLRSACRGYRENLGNNSHIVVMGVKAATTGRLSISFYHKMSGSRFMENIEKWYSTCYWSILDMRREKGKRRFTGSPPLMKMAEAAFGNRNSKVLTSTYERLVPCIILGRRIPKDIVRKAFLRAVNPASYDSTVQWQVDVDTACAMIRKLRYDMKKEEWSVSLDRNEKDRSYLFGRLLAAARKLEEVALYLDKENTRSTSAERYFNQFQKKPASTWKTVRNNLEPYILKLKGKNRTYYEREIMAITDMFDKEKFEDNSRLSELFLLGYDSQYMSYNDSREEKENA